MGILKRHSMLFVAATAIIGLSSFEMAKEKLQSVYWFEFDSNGNLVNQAMAPTPSSTNPFSCDGEEENCAQAFTNYTPLAGGGFAPGTPAEDDLGNPIIEKRDSQ